MDEFCGAKPNIIVQNVKRICALCHAFKNTMNDKIQMNHQHRHRMTPPKILQRHLAYGIIQNQVHYRKLSQKIN